MDILAIRISSSIPFLPLTAGVQRESLSDRAETPAAEQRVGPERGADQDLVPEQAGQDQEVDGLQKSAGTAADGPGIVQPHHRAADQGGGGARDAHERADPLSADQWLPIRGYSF